MLMRDSVDDFVNLLPKVNSVESNSEQETRTADEEAGI
jgi:hypothetical protein